MGSLWKGNVPNVVRLLALLNNTRVPVRRARSLTSIVLYSRAAAILPHPGLELRLQGPVQAHVRGEEDGALLEAVGRQHLVWR